MEGAVTLAVTLAFWMILQVWLLPRLGVPT
jgi:hypothetical protein